MDESITKIIEAGTLAPSGDNCQPWRFDFIKPNILKIHLLPEADKSLYNFKNRGSYIAHGAFIENMKIIAPSFGYELEVELFPEEENELCTAQIRFVKNDTVVQNKMLESALFERTTNRKPYKTTELSDEITSQIQNSIASFNSISLKFVVDRKKIKAVAKHISLNEQLMLENKYIHDTLFNLVRWTETEEKKYKNGLYLKTLELSIPQQKAFSVFRRWSILKFLNVVLRVSKLLPKASAKNYRSSGSICAFTINALTPKEYIIAGMAIERAWITAVSLGYAMQPITAIPYLAQRIIDNDASKLSAYEQEKILKSNNGIRSLFELSDSQSIAMILRIGKAEPSSARSCRIPLCEKITIK